VDAAEPGACAIRFGGAWFSLFPDRVLIEPDPGEDEEPKVLRRTLPRGEFVSLRLDYEPGRTVLRVNGRKRAEVAADPDDPRVRPVLLGNRSAEENNGGDHCWAAVSHAATEPCLDRAYSWDWTPQDGLPDAWTRARVLELRNARGLAYGDYGYSGWTTLGDGRFFCVFHHADPHDPGYRPNHGAMLLGAWFEPGDFGA
jgi:hypothetical protein